MILNSNEVKIIVLFCIFIYVIWHEMKEKKKTKIKIVKNLF